MALTDIADQRTPAVPVEINVAAELGLPSANQELLIIGRAASGMAASSQYMAFQINNVNDPTLAQTEAAAKFGGTSAEIVKMIVAAVNANSGGSTFPTIRAIPLASTDADFGSTDQALVTARSLKAEFIVSPYDANNSVLRGKLSTHCALVSGATRPENNQFGSLGVTANRSVTDPSTLPTPDTQFLIPVWFRDTGTGGNAPAYSLGEVAAAVAAFSAANAVPFNPIDNLKVSGIAAPALLADYITVGGGLESETALVKGWTPLRVKANGDVAVVRLITSRITNGISSAAVTAYYDAQDWQVMFYWRKTLWTRLNQPDIKNQKASINTAKLILGEVLRLAQSFEDNNMFQAVAKLASQFVVQRSSSDRHRFDVLTPINVVPGLHVVAVNVVAGTQFDSFSI